MFFRGEQTNIPGYVPTGVLDPDAGTTLVLILLYINYAADGFYPHLLTHLPHVNASSHECGQRYRM